MKVSLLTPIRVGGPFNWHKDLACALNQSGMQAKHIHNLPALVRLCFYRDADIVHTTVRISFKLWKKPVVLTVHGDYTVEKNMWQRFYPKTTAQADAVTAPSQYLKQKLGLENAIVIPNASFPEKFKLAEYQKGDCNA